MSRLHYGLLDQFGPEDNDPGTAFIIHNVDDTVTIKVRSPGDRVFSEIEMPLDVWVKLRNVPAIGTPDGAREAVARALQSAWDNSRDGFEIDAMVDAALTAIPREQEVKPDDAIKLTYIKRWRTIVKLPAQYADEIRDALAAPPSDSPGSARQPEGRLTFWGSAHGLKLAEQALARQHIPTEAEIERLADDLVAAGETDAPQPQGGDAREIADKIIADPTVIWLRECGFNSSAKFESELHSAILRALATPPTPVLAAAEPGEITEEMLEIGAQALADDCWHPPQPLKCLSGTDVRRFKRQALLVLKAALSPASANEGSGR